MRAIRGLARKGEGPGPTGAVVLALVGALAPSGAADTGVLRVGPVEVRHYSPDWIWQDQKVNVLVVLRSRSAEREAVDLSLELPPGPFFAAPAGEVPGSSGSGEAGPRRLVRHIVLGPGETRRAAFANIAARGRDPATGIALPRRVFVFRLRARSGAESAERPVAVRTIRGALVRGGVWSIALPAAVGLLWALGLVAVLTRLSPRDAWRRAREAIPASGGGPREAS